MSGFLSSLGRENLVVKPRIKTLKELGIVGHIITVLRRLGQKGCYKVEASLSCVVKSRTVWSTESLKDK